MIKVDVKGDWSKTEKLLENVSKKRHYKVLTKYGDRGVEALQSVTPVDTGLTAASWRYEVTETRDQSRLTFHNDNVNNGVNIALVVNYGHATRRGGWVEGRHFIEPTIQEVFDKLADELWKEVTKL